MCSKLAVEIERRVYVPRSKQTVGQHLEEWLREVEPLVRPSTWASFESHVRQHIEPRLGAVKLQHLDRARVVGLSRELLQEGASLEAALVPQRFAASSPPCTCRRPGSRDAFPIDSRRKA
jgi:hypothetical protein